MALTMGTFIVNRPIRGTMFDSTGDVLWTVNDLKDPTLTASTETEDAVDALGSPIMRFDRSKMVELSATSANIDLGLMAARGGVARIDASGSQSVIAPSWETFDVLSTDTTITLSYTPYAEGSADPVPFIWELSPDGHQGTKYTLSDTAASATEFTITTVTITLPTGRTADSTFIVYYEYEATGATDLNAIEIDYASDEFPSVGKFVLEVLGHDKCDAQTNYYAYIIFENAKLSCDMDLTLNATATDNFTITALPQYCASTKTCFKLIIPEA